MITSNSVAFWKQKKKKNDQAYSKVSQKDEFNEAISKFET